MYPSLALEVRGKVADYLAGDCSLNDLKDWIVAAPWDVEATGDVDAVDVAYKVIHALAILDDDGDLNHLRSLLRPLATSYTYHASLTEGAREPILQTSSSVTSTTPLFHHRPVLVGTPL